MGGIPDVVHRPELGTLVAVKDVEGWRARWAMPSRRPRRRRGGGAGARGGWDDSAGRPLRTLEAACGVNGGVEAAGADEPAVSQRAVGGAG